MNRTKKNTSRFEVDISFFGTDNQLTKRWFMTERELLYFNGCRIIDRQKVSETSDIFHTLLSVDSLKLMNNYGCNGDVPIHGENSVQIIGSAKTGNFERHFNFKIYNCFLNQKISILMNQINEKIDSPDIPKMSSVQLIEKGCKCENFKFVKIYK